MGVLKLVDSGEIKTSMVYDSNDVHDRDLQEDVESLAQEIRTLKEEMRWAREYGPRLVDALKDSTDRLAQVQERLATHDSALSELFDRGRQEVLIRQSYERYLPPHLIQELAANPGRVNLGGEARRVTILFADFRGFTATASQMDPQDVIRVLNSYFTQIAETIYRYGGSIDKFMGDGFMAIFGAPAALEDDALRAVRAGLEIQKFLAISGTGKAEPSGFRLPMGIGVNTGDVVVGALGSPNRMDFTAIGDTVNVAARLTGKALPGQVLLGYSTYMEVRSKVKVNLLPRLRLKGKSNPIRPYLAVAEEA